MHGNRLFPAPVVERKTACEKQYYRTDRKPDITGNELPRQDSPESDWIRRKLVLQRKLTCEKESEQGPDRPYPNPFDKTPAFTREVFHERYIYHLGAALAKPVVTKRDLLLTGRFRVRVTSLIYLVAKQIWTRSKVTWVKVNQAASSLSADAMRSWSSSTA